MESCPYPHPPLSWALGPEPTLPCYYTLLQLWYS